MSIASDSGLIAATPSKFYATIRKEVTEAFGRFYLAVYLAWSDTRTRYRRSVLGPFWLVLGTAIGVGGLGISTKLLVPTGGAVVLAVSVIFFVFWAADIFLA